MLKYFPGCTSSGSRSQLSGFYSDFSFQIKCCFEYMLGFHLLWQKSLHFDSYTSTSFPTSSASCTECIAKVKALNCEWWNQGSRLAIFFQTKLATDFVLSDHMHLLSPGDLQGLVISFFVSGRFGHPPAEKFTNLVVAALHDRASTRQGRARANFSFDPITDRPPGYFSALWAMILASTASELDDSVSSALGFNLKQILHWLPAMRCYPFRWDTSCLVQQPRSTSSSANLSSASSSSLSCRGAHSAFQDWFTQVYFATHVIYVVSQYRFRVEQPFSQRLLLPEYHCVMEALPIGILVENADLVGECVDTLHMMGECSETNPLLRAGIEFLLKSQQAGGSWSSRHGVLAYNASDPDEHHATFVCMWALLSEPISTDDQSVRLHSCAGILSSNSFDSQSVLETMSHDTSYAFTASYIYPACDSVKHSTECSVLSSPFVPLSSATASSIISFLVCSKE